MCVHEPCGASRCGCYLTVINYVIKRSRPGVYMNYRHGSVYCKCTVHVQVYLWVCCSVGTYLVAAGLVPDELEPWNALLGARHSDIFWMFAVRHTEAIGLTLSKALLSTSAVQVVEPDTAWNIERQREFVFALYRYELIKIRAKWLYLKI